MNITNWKKGAILFTVLLFPSLVYVILSSGDHSFISRPIFGPKSVNDNGDTIYYQVQGVPMETCESLPVTLEDFRGKILVLSFFNPTDSLLSSRVNGQMMSIQDRFRDNTDVMNLSIGIFNTMEQRAQACKIIADYKSNSGKKWKWSLVTEAEALQFAKYQLLLPNDSITGKLDFSQVVLLDKKGRIRSYRDGKQYVEIKTLGDDIKVVKAEDFISKKHDNETRK